MLDGKTDIKDGITYSRFESAPDAPFTVFETVLPAGPHSVLTANVPESEDYSLCKTSLAMPTEITGQNGAVINQNTKIAVSGCGGVLSTKDASSPRHSCSPKRSTRAASATSTPRPSAKPANAGPASATRRKPSRSTLPRRSDPDTATRAAWRMFLPDEGDRGDRCAAAMVVQVHRPAVAVKARASRLRGDGPGMPRLRTPLHSSRGYTQERARSLTSGPRPRAWSRPKTPAPAPRSTRSSQNVGLSALQRCKAPDPGPGTRGRERLR